ncbi:hypothetical protein EXN66_Car005449 [Channa argus]|uniref:Uncharacterized protein n=1 Tax=Channa argus TaxID=215402 RepID=A0A6G1PHR5_CHAAH|nr:hypothetical protein EXN66_Car005449 [Channa argus]
MMPHDEMLHMLQCGLSSATVWSVISMFMLVVLTCYYSYTLTARNMVPTVTC